MAKPELTVEAAVALVDYYARRNRVAKTSHDKTWYAKHKDVEFLLL